MEAHVEINGMVENGVGVSHIPANIAASPAQPEPFGVATQASSYQKRMVVGGNNDTQEKNTSPSVSNCYVFKSRLQEYCQKAALTTPVYETIKEGPSHEPSFRSTVIVNNIRYDSLPGFFNRKAAEQSAAEVALLELSSFVDTKFGIAEPVHQTGLCKNLLQEYSQKMNYAIPLYECQKDEKQGRTTMYSCVVEIGGIKYIGASATTKKEAEIKAARTALLAIQSSSSMSEDNHATNSIYTVVPQKKKPSDLGISTQEIAAALKPKRGRFKKQQRKKRRPMKRDNSAPDTTHLDQVFNTDSSKTGSASFSQCDLTGCFMADTDGPAGINMVTADATGSQEKSTSGLPVCIDAGEGNDCV